MWNKLTVIHENFEQNTLLKRFWTTLQMGLFIKVRDLTQSWIKKLKGHRISDQYPVAIKQVPRSRISSMIQVGDRKMPTEFFMHLKAAKCDGVVKVRLNFHATFSRKSNSGTWLVRTANKLCYCNGKAMQFDGFVRIFETVWRHQRGTREDNHQTGL